MGGRREQGRVVGHLGVFVELAQADQVGRTRRHPEKRGGDGALQPGIVLRGTAERDESRADLERRRSRQLREGAGDAVGIARPCRPCHGFGQRRIEPRALARRSHQR